MVNKLIKACILFLLCGLVMAEGPAWWTERGVLTSDPPEDNAPVVLGQLKLMANEAYHELMEKVPLDVSHPVRLNLENQLNTWLPDGVENAVANIGQVKKIGSLVYDWLIEAGYTNSYPWTDGPVQDPEDFAAALIGQVKFIFNFEPPESHPATNYVSLASANPSPPYRTWETAAHTIQEALNVIGPNGVVIVGDGVYSTGWRVSPSEGMVSFNRIVIGQGVTVRSLNGAENTVITGGSMPDMRCAYLCPDSRLEGFTLQNGRTLSTGADGSGGGAFCADSSAIVSHCNIWGNQAYFYGGGVFGGTVEFSNISWNGSGWNGGGLYDSIAYNCLINGNGAPYSGGGAALGALKGCLVTANYASGSGGGVYGASDVASCTIVGNSTTSYEADGGGVAYCGTVRNSIIYGNEARSYGFDPSDNHYSCSDISYSCTLPLPSGAGNIDDDPLFMQTARGQYDLSVDSPCIDSGQNETWMTGATDISGLDRLINGTVDMGTYESPGGSRGIGSIDAVPLTDVALTEGDIVSQQTFSIANFQVGWDQVFITSFSSGAGDINLTGLYIAVLINGVTTSLGGSNNEGGYNLTSLLSEAGSSPTITIFLISDGSKQISADALYLVKWTPDLNVDFGLSFDYLSVGESFGITISIPEEPPVPGVGLEVEIVSEPAGDLTFSADRVTLSQQIITAVGANSSASVGGTTVRVRNPNGNHEPSRTKSLTIYGVDIKAEDGHSAPVSYLDVGDTVSYQAVTELELSGYYVWSIEGVDGITLESQFGMATLRMTSGSTMGPEGALIVTFTPWGGNDWTSSTDTHYLTVEEEEEDPLELVMIKPHYIGVPTSPDYDSEFKWSFNAENPGVCDVNPEGTCGVPSLNPNLEWELWSTDGNGDPLPGSVMTSTPDPPKGAKPIFTFTGLPSQNSSFAVTKMLDLRYPESGLVPIGRRIYLFFSRDEKNHPGASSDSLVPNWYYYWKQTSADFGTHQYRVGSRSYCDYEEGSWRCFIENSTVSYDVLLYNERNKTDYTYKTGIDHYAFVVRHEEQHRLDMSSEQNWGNNNRVADQDRDKDGLKDENEDKFVTDRRYDPEQRATFPNTWGYAPAEDFDDAEDAALWQQQWPTPGAYDGEDWAKPGARWE